jgi:surface-anchored protein
MKHEHPIRWGVTLLGLLTIASSAHAQGHCAKVSQDVTLYFGIETNLPDPNHPTTVDMYHTDVEVSFRSSGWDPVISYDEPGTGVKGRDLPPQDALLYGNANSRWVLPSIPAGFEFIGAEAGQPFWILPQSAGTGVLPLGFAAQCADTGRLCRWNPHDSRGAATADLWVEVRLLDVRGPTDAHFALWQADGIHPPVVFMSTHDWGLTEKNILYISAGSHMHLNWGFTRPGRYALDLRLSTVLHCDDWLTADWAPPGDDAYYGDGRVDFRDFAGMAASWLQTPQADDLDTLMFIDPDNPSDPIGIDELAALAEQWLQCGYPGCEQAEGQNLTP